MRSSEDEMISADGTSAKLACPTHEALAPFHSPHLEVNRHRLHRARGPSAIHLKDAPIP